MSTMSELEHLMYDDMGEPLTPRDCAQYEVAMAVKAAMDAGAALNRLRLDPVARTFVANEEKELWAAWSQLALVLTGVRTDNDNSALPGMDRHPRHRREYMR